MATGVNVLVALDASRTSRAALDFAVKQILLLPHGGAGDACNGHITVVTITPEKADLADVKDDAAYAAIYEASAEKGENRGEQAAAAVLEAATARLFELGVASDRVTALKVGADACGGSPGVGSALSRLAEEVQPDVVVMGSRGLGVLKRSVLSLLGMGSVSDYCLHQMHRPLVVWHGDEERYRDASSLKPGRKVLLALDSSEASHDMLLWALRCALVPTDQLHLVSVALPSGQAVVMGAGDPVLAASAHSADESRMMMGEARDTCRRAVLTAQQHQFPVNQLYYKALSPEGGAGQVAESLVHYARANDMQLAVVGSRALGGLQRAMLAVVGSGSVSDYLVHQLSIPVLVVKH